MDTHFKFKTENELFIYTYLGYFVVVAKQTDYFVMNNY